MQAAMQRAGPGQDGQAPQMAASTRRQPSPILRQSHLADTFATPSPLSTAPKTPAPKMSQDRRVSQPTPSPLQRQQTTPARAPSLRRTSSATSLGPRPTSSSSPALTRRTSRQSLVTRAEELEKRPPPKRSISNLIAGLREAQSTMEPIEEPVALTTPQIAMEHFTKALINNAQHDTTADVAVILHDACYGHRYSRLKTTKSTLGMIVERPERIHAAVLGASAAYVRLGEHHAGGHNAPHPEKYHAHPPPFKIRRTARSMDITSACVTNVHGSAWMSELRVMCQAASDKLAAGSKELDRPATSTDPGKQKLHEGDLYLCSQSLDAFQGALGGVADAVDAVFSLSDPTSRAFVAIRPPGHHCSADYPSGFCWLNNVHVGIEYAAKTHGLTHVAIIDFDLHHGDGSQAIAWERNRGNNLKRLNAKPHSKLKLSPDIGYFSLHDINSYPCENSDDDKVQAASLCVENAHGQTVWNVHLQPWKTEGEFWQLYADRYYTLLEKARAFLRHHSSRLRLEDKVTPRAAIFISAGFDASEWESAGMQRHKVNVPTDFYARFTRDIVRLAQEGDSGCEGRVISVLEGGYSDRALCSGVMSHLSGLSVQPRDAIKKEPPTLNDMMNGLQIQGVTGAAPSYYDTAWWSAANLTALEQQVNPAALPAAGKKVRTGPQPTYATPTESFAYKVVDPTKFARSISGTMREVQMPARVPTPPPPDVDWIVATQELCKLLIPIDRQTKSCTPDQLGGVRTKKDGQSAMPALATSEDAAGPRQLRDRKAKTPFDRTDGMNGDEAESVRSVSRSSNRRQTMHELPSAFPEPGGQPAHHQRRASRRLSAGSVLSLITCELDNDAPPVPALPNIPLRVNGTMRPPAVPVPRAAARDIQIKKPRAPSKPSKIITPSSNPVSPAMSQAITPTILGPHDAVPSTNSHDYDSLSSSMKKITLKVGSRAEHDKKQEEKLATERRARGLKAAETRRANAAAKKAAAVQQQEAAAHVATGVAAGAQQLQLSKLPLMPTAVDTSIGSQLLMQRLAMQNGYNSQPDPDPTYHTPEQSNFHAMHPQAPSVPGMPVEHGESLSIQSSNQATQAPPSCSLESPVHDLTQPNGSAPSQAQSFLNSTPASRSWSSPGNSGKKLPVFTSTGAIPFAAVMPSSPTSKKQPHSPRTQPKNPWRHKRDASDQVGDGNGVSKSMLEGKQDEVVGPEPSIVANARADLNVERLG